MHFLLFNLINSGYKRYFKKNKINKNSSEENDIKKITNNLVIENKDNEYVLSKIDKNNNKELLDEVKKNSKRGLVLSNYFEEDKNPVQNQTELDKLNLKIKSMSLADYI